MDNYPIPLGHRQTPDEQAAPLIFLNSPAASAITGESILTDGGTMAALVRRHPRRLGLRVLSGGTSQVPDVAIPEPSPARAEPGNTAIGRQNFGDPGSRAVVYGGQLLAQMILASDWVAETKAVASIHAIFARAGKVSDPIEIDGRRHP